MRISAEDHPRPQVRPLTVAQSTQPAGDLGRRKRRPSVNGFANGAGGDAGGGAIYSADESLTLIDVEFRSNIAHAEGTRMFPHRKERDLAQSVRTRSSLCVVNLGRSSSASGPASLRCEPREKLLCVRSRVSAV
jgi:hypothetical protein